MNISKEPHVKKRRLKVYYGHHRNSYQRYPVIRISGNYLKQAGFKIGDKIELTIEGEQILITKLINS